MELRALFEAHYPSIWRLLRRLGVRPAQIDDAAQEVFWVAARRLSDIEPGREHSFLYGVAMRVASNEVRRQSAAMPVASLDEITFGEPRPEELDPVLLLWRMHRRVYLHRLPVGRTVVEFDFTGRNGRRLWLVLERSETSVCLRPPGFRPQLVLRADLSLFHQVWLGAVEYASARRDGDIVVDGPPALVRALPDWFRWSPMMRWVRSALAAAPQVSPRPERSGEPRKKNRTSRGSGSGIRRRRGADGGPEMTE